MILPLYECFLSCFTVFYSLSLFGSSLLSMSDSLSLSLCRLTQTICPSVYRMQDSSLYLSLVSCSVLNDLHVQPFCVHVNEMSSTRISPVLFCARIHHLLLDSGVLIDLLLSFCAYIDYVRIGSETPFSRALFRSLTSPFRRHTNGIYREPIE